MKRTVVLIAGLILVVASAGLFAAGQREGQTAPQASGAPAAPSPAQPGYGPWGLNLGKEQTITGKVSLAGEFHPLLTSGGTTYELLVPRFLAFEIGVKDGQTLTVKGSPLEGQLPPRARFTLQDGTTPLWLASATINGKSYDLATLGSGNRRGPGWGHGGHFGMMGYGPGFGHGGYGYGPMMGYGRGPMMDYGPGWGYGPRGSNGPGRDWDDQ